jgi:SAM-dependent methyltransferase
MICLEPRDLTSGAAAAWPFPDCQVVGIDPNEHSITRARAGAAAEGVGRRLQFHAQTTAELDPNGGFDLITAYDCIHDFAAPHATLREMRSLLKPNGVVFAMEPKASDRLEDNINSLGTVYYGISLFHCMTQWNQPIPLHDAIFGTAWAWTWHVHGANAHGRALSRSGLHALRAARHQEHDESVLCCACIKRASELALFACSFAQARRQSCDTVC